MKYNLGNLQVNLDSDFDYYIRILNPYILGGLMIDNRIQRLLNKYADRRLDPEKFFLAWASEVNSYVDEMIPVIIDCLIENDIYDYDKERFKEEFKDELNIENSIYYQRFAEKYAEYIQYQEGLKQRRQYERENRSYWEGGGFGLRGAVMGSVKAKALNAATDVFRGMGDSFTDFVDKQDILRRKDELGETQEIYEFVQSGLSRIIDTNLPTCLFTVLEKKTKKKADVILGRKDKEVRPLFNNLGLVDEKKRLHLLKQILETNPRKPEYLAYLIENAKSLGLDTWKVSDFVIDVNCGFYLRYIQNGTDILCNLWNEELIKAKNTFDPDSVQRCLELHSALKDFVDQSTMYPLTSCCYKNDTDESTNMMWLDYAKPLIYLAEGEWIQTCSEKDINPENINSIPLNESTSLLADWESIVAKYDFDNIPTHEDLAYQDFLNVKEKLLEVMKLGKAALEKETAIKEYGKALKAKAETLPLDEKAVLQQIKQAFTNAGIERLSVFPDKVLINSAYEIIDDMNDTEIPAVMNTSKKTFCLTNQNLYVWNCKSPSAVPIDHIVGITKGSWSPELLIHYYCQGDMVLWHVTLKMDDIFPIMGNTELKEQCSALGMAFSRALSVPYMERNSLKPDHDVLESVKTILESNITTAEKYEKILNNAIKSHAVVCSDGCITVCADTAFLGNELLNQAFSTNDTKWIRSLFRNRLYEQDLKDYLCTNMPILAVLAVRSKYGDSLEQLKPKTVDQANEMLSDIQHIYWQHDLMTVVNGTYKFKEFYGIEEGEPKTFAYTANSILVNLQFSVKSLTMIENVKAGAQGLLNRFMKRKQ